MDCNSNIREATNWKHGNSYQLVFITKQILYFQHKYINMYLLRCYINYTLPETTYSLKTATLIFSQETLITRNNNIAFQAKIIFQYSA